MSRRGAVASQSRWPHLVVVRAHIRPRLAEQLATHGAIWLPLALTDRRGGPASYWGGMLDLTADQVRALEALGKRPDDVRTVRADDRAGAGHPLHYAAQLGLLPVVAD